MPGPYVVIAGDTHTVWEIDPVADLNSATPGKAIDLTGATGATLTFVSQAGTAVAGTGTAGISGGLVTYAPSAADIAAPGQYQVWVVVTFSDNSKLPLQPFALSVLAT